MQTVALIDYGSGNLRSAERALAAAAAKANRRREIRVTRDADFIRRADKLVLPGQGAFGDCLAGLKALPGVIEAMEEAVLGRGAAFLGICVGMQLLAARGLEHGEHRGLGWVGGVCRPLAPGAGRVPHMGWNLAAPLQPHPVLAPLGDGAHVYFAHSYVVADAPAGALAAETLHNERFAAALARDTILGLQFHPEKSQAVGLAVLARFLDWNP